MPHSSDHISASYYIGCPVWACEGWVGSMYSTAKRRTWLGEYSQVFNTVEGNNTFYGMPTVESAQRWADETQDGFRFALKFPRVITHEARLRLAHEETKLFLRALEVLQEANRLGPSFLQLPPQFSAREFPALESYLRQLSRSFPFAVEVRHLDFFRYSSHDDRLNELLFELGMDRVIFDSRALFHADPTDDYEAESQRRKPNLPVRPVVVGERPMLRFVGRNNVDEVEAWIEEWVPVVAEWIDRGKTPYVFTHSPNDLFAPEFAKRFHVALQAVCPLVQPLPETWPGQKHKRQRELF